MTCSDAVSIETIEKALTYAQVASCRCSSLIVFVVYRNQSLPRYYWGFLVRHHSVQSVHEVCVHWTSERHADTGEKSFVGKSLLGCNWSLLNLDAATCDKKVAISYFIDLCDATISSSKFCNVNVRLTWIAFAWTCSFTSLFRDPLFRGEGETKWLWTCYVTRQRL